MQVLVCDFCQKTNKVLRFSLRNEDRTNNISTDLCADCFRDLLFFPLIFTDLPNNLYYELASKIGKNTKNFTVNVVEKEL